MFYRLHLNESREVLCGKGRGRSFYVDGLKTEMAQEPAVESLVQGFSRLRVLEAEITAQLIILCTLISLFLMNGVYSLYCQHEEYQQ